MKNNPPVEPMMAIKEYFQSKISLGNIIIGAFIIGGFYYVTPQQIAQNSESIEQHITEQFIPMRAEVQENTEAIGRIEAGMIPREEAVDQSDLSNLRELMREIQSSQTQQMKNLNARLDYIIERLDK